jgi:hypothetical protein
MVHRETIIESTIVPISNHHSLQDKQLTIMVSPSTSTVNLQENSFIAKATKRDYQTDASPQSGGSSRRTLVFSLALCVVVVVALCNEYLQAPVSLEDSTVLTKKSYQLKAPFPIFDASLFKSGTTTAHEYFLCGGQRSIHHGYPYPLHKMIPARFKKIGFFIRNNIRKGRSPFASMSYDIFHEPGIQEGDGLCWHPSVHALEEIYEAYPNSTILQIVRPAEKWVRSLKRYKKGAVMRRVGSCTCKNFPRDLYGDDLTDEDFANFYTQQVERVRDFASAHPSLNYIEVDLEDPNIGKVLEDRVGIEASCWGHANGTPKYKWWYVAKM